MTSSKQPLNEEEGSNRTPHWPGEHGTRAREARHARASSVESDRPRGKTRPRTSATINTTSTGEYCKRQPTQRLVGICYCYTNKKPEGSEHGMITLYDGTHQMDNNDEMNVKTDPASMRQNT
ncbi:hypothetical protein BaRGS_00010780 [Batillaria attramentaria]|uniref:Uncharacterized protein n=1 Tax=Batillaria attramentaria TaxID=370345 RepID=A0ABD0LEC6_9CAEN